MNGVFRLRAKESSGESFVSAPIFDTTVPPEEVMRIQEGCWFSQENGCLKVEESHRGPRFCHEEGDFLNSAMLHLSGSNQPRNILPSSVEEYSTEYKSEAIGQYEMETLQSGFNYATYSNYSLGQNEEIPRSHSSYGNLGREIDTAFLRVDRPVHSFTSKSKPKRKRSVTLPAGSLPFPILSPTDTKHSDPRQYFHQRQNSAPPAECEPISKPKSTVKPEKTKKAVANSKPWKDREEVFLVGCVFDMYFRRGSLTPNKKQRATVTDENYCWEKIRRIYDKAINRFEELTGEVANPRTMHAITRHFKVIKSKLSSNVGEVDEEDEYETEDFELKKMYFEWETLYNENNILTCTDEKYALRKLSLNTFRYGGYRSSN
eukprot:snap_masked-scaffold_1-processed-gene-3.26-mRNA-1 protein AED:1.00 eAED:1.00 QI:0/-1/0/0/-1/1/1/0/374